MGPLLIGAVLGLLQEGLECEEGKKRRERDASRCGRAVASSKIKIKLNEKMKVRKGEREREYVRATESNTW